MSINKIIINNIQDFIYQWGLLENNSIALITPQENIIVNTIYYDKIINLLNDDKIAFLYTDAITINNENIKNIEYLNGIDLPNIPFFIKKINNIQFNDIQNENIMIDIMKAFVDNGYYFQHIADPIVCINI